MKFDQETIKVNTIKAKDIKYYVPLKMAGPGTWKAVHDFDYGASPEDISVPLRQQTFPQAARLFTFALKNKDHLFVAPVIEAVHKYVLTGDTILLWTPEGLYGVDRPEKEIVEQFGVDSQIELKKIQKRLNERLSGAIGSVVYTSPDGQVRFTNHDSLIYDSQERSVFGSNAGLITLVGDNETAKALAEASNAYRSNSTFFGVRKQDVLTLRVPVFNAYSFDDRLDVIGDGVNDCGHNRCSFGGMEVAKPLAENLKI